jgi:hypothetical protein
LKESGCRPFNRLPKTLYSFIARHHSRIFPEASDEERLRYLGELHALYWPDRTLGNPIQEMQYRLSFLLANQARLDHLIGDFELFARRSIERAFVHLQRMLIVDKGLNHCWLKAFNTKRKGEVLVEKLGAVHLLGHGIWAFKVDATGERTDLFLGEPLKNVQEDVIRTAEVLDSYNLNVRDYLSHF